MNKVEVNGLKDVKELHLNEEDTNKFNNTKVGDKITISPIIKGVKYNITMVITKRTK